jgi:protein SCO1/2
MLVVGGCGSQASTPSAPQFTGVVRNPPPLVDAVALPDASDHGRPLSLRGAAGGILLVYFGYTRCPDVCPTTMSDVRVALAGLTASERRRVRVAMITVDPRRDTPPVLRRYVHAFFSHGSALRTPDAKRLARVAKAFGAAFRITKRADGTVEVLHTTYVYAVDHTGRLRVQWAYGTRPVTYQRDIRLLLGRPA